jgi:hypothetical protein
MGSAFGRVLKARFGFPFICYLVWSWPASYGVGFFLCVIFAFYLWNLFMKKRLLMAALVAWLWGNQAAAQDCLKTEALVALDARYETALQGGDADFLQTLLAAEFYWVHNLASLKEDKAALIARVKQPTEQAKQRRSHDITAQRLGNTVVLQGLSSVDKWNDDGKTHRTSRYQFMRTYVAVEDECKLLAVQTMKVWSSDSQ